ncbi:MAG: hypothetical protein GY925_23845 [Actinomycetia bacterium]|nr:hypothetical protein [Actinomycetes bacterium]
MMGHRLGFKGWLLAWSAGIFYVLMVLTSPTQVIPATMDLLAGIVGAANSAGDHVGDVHEEYERTRIAEEVRAEVCAELHPDNTNNLETCIGTLTTTDNTNPSDEAGDGVSVEGDASRYYGPADALPAPGRVWRDLHWANDAAGDTLDGLGLGAGQ